MNENILNSALHYVGFGWSVFPCHSVRDGKCSCGKPDCKNPGKHPRTEHGFKDATKDVTTIIKWWSMWPDANIGCATGSVFGILVLDLDAKHNRTSKNLEFPIPLTVSAKTGGNGEHFFLKSPKYKVKSTNGELFGPGVDIKADDGYVILSPSTHISGNTYEWMIPPGDIELAEAPQWLLEAINKHDKTKNKKLWKKGVGGVSEGERNSVAISLAGAIKNSLPIEIRETLGWPTLLTWNSKNNPPLNESELRNVWDSANKYPDNEQSTARKQTETLLEIIDSEKETELFHDENGDTFIKLNINDHTEIWPCKSKMVTRWLNNEYWKKKNKALGSEATKNTIAVLEGRATFDGPLIKLSNRSSWLDDCIWYDLTNENWQAVKVSSSGWEIINNPPVLFRRYTHNKSQVSPQKEGDVRLFINYVNITNEEHKLLLLVSIISSFISGFAHPVIVIFGSQGSAKTTLSKLLRKLIDPSSIEVASMPDNHKELVQALAHHYFLFFDNVSFISENVSDILCKAITGGGFIKRELYTDDEDIVYNLKRNVGINGINLISTRPDLLERSILLELDRIDPSQRKQEKDIHDAFERDLPVILGGVFDVLVKALKIKPTIQLSTTPRMADFTTWGCAIAEALGYTTEEFLRAYQNNIDGQTEVVLNDNPIAMAIISFMKDKKEWKGEPTEFYNSLTEHAKFENITHNYDSNWPKAPNHLIRRLNVLRVNLELSGMKFVSSGGTKRQVIIQKIAPTENIVKTIPFQDSTDSIDDKF